MQGICYKIENKFRNIIYLKDVILKDFKDNLIIINTHKSDEFKIFLVLFLTKKLLRI